MEGRLLPEPPLLDRRVNTMINIWGVCTLGAGTYDQMTRWDLCCTFFGAGNAKRAEEIKECCANCLYWFVFDEHLIRSIKLEATTSKEECC